MSLKYSGTEHAYRFLEGIYAVGIPAGYSGRMLECKVVIDRHKVTMFLVGDSFQEIANHGKTKNKSHS